MITPLNYYANFVVGNSLTVNNTTPEITGGTPPPLPADGDLLIALIGTMGTRFGSPSNRAPQLSAYDGWEILSTIEVSGTAGLFQYTNTSYRLTVLTRPFAAGPWTFGASGAEQMTGVVIGFRGAEQAKNPTAVNLNAWVQSIDIPAHSDVPAGSYYLIAALHGRFEAQWYQAPNTLPAPYAQLANSFSTPQGSGLDPAMFLQGYESGGGAPAATTVWHWYPGVSAAIAFELTEITTLEYVGWDASDDLPTEDVTAPAYARKGLRMTLPRYVEPSSSIDFVNPLAPNTALFRGKPINPVVSGAVLTVELEGVEARWQRARPKSSVIEAGPLTVKQALEALLAKRAAEFSFLQYETIPEIYWPDGTIPQFPNLVLVVDPADRNRPSVYDEVKKLLGVAPGYTLDFNASDKLRVVVPPFAPNAQAALDLDATQGTWELTGYSTTDLVRSVRVISTPYNFDSNPVDIINPTTARYASSVFNPYAQPEPDGDVTVTNRARVTVAGTTFEETWDVPYNNNQLFSAATATVDVELKVWIHPEASGVPGTPDLLHTYTDTGNTLNNDGTEQLIAAFQPGDTLAIPKEPAYFAVYARIVDERIRFRVVGTLRAFGGRLIGLLGLSYRWWDLGYTVKVVSTGAVWSQGTTTYSGQYIYEPGYLDLPELDVSLLGITDSTVLNTLAQHIGEYRSRQATRYSLSITQPWSVSPSDKGRRINLGTSGVQVVLDSIRQAVQFTRQGTIARFEGLAWKYDQITFERGTPEGDTRVTTAGDVRVLGG